MGQRTPVSRRIRHFLDARDWTAVRVGLLIPLLAESTWMIFWRNPASAAQAECARRYAAATTAADTLRIDRQGVGARTKVGAWNCGMLRRAACSAACSPARDPHSREGPTAPPGGW